MNDEFEGEDPYAEALMKLDEAIDYLREAGATDDDIAAEVKARLR